VPRLLIRHLIFGHLSENGPCFQRLLHRGFAQRKPNIRASKICMGKGKKGDLFKNEMENKKQPKQLNATQTP
jgi:hypothetical protein